MKAKVPIKKMELSITVDKDGSDVYNAKNTGLTIHEAVTLAVWVQQILIRKLTEKQP